MECTCMYTAPYPSGFGSIFYSIFFTELENIAFNVFLQNLLKIRRKVLVWQFHKNCLKMKMYTWKSFSHSDESFWKALCSSLWHLWVEEKPRYDALLSLSAKGQWGLMKDGTCLLTAKPYWPTIGQSGRLIFKSHFTIRYCLNS